MKTKQIIIPLIAIIIVGASVGTINPVHAQTNNNPLASLVDMIAQKFGLDKTQVQSVVNEYHEKRKTEMHQKMEDHIDSRLDQAVKNGKLTEVQKQAIINKLNELKNKYNSDNWKNMTPDQKKEAMKKEQDDLKTWAQSQGIDPSYLMGSFGMRRPGFKKWMSPNPAK